jgi:hypothetical protein
LGEAYSTGQPGEFRHLKTTTGPFAKIALPSRSFVTERAYQA